jgi:DNA-binding response OmpR family regulator
MSARILVIEGHEENRRILRYLLASAGFEMIEALTGEDGVAAAEKERPGLILMDIQLPGLDGYEADQGQPRAAAHPDHRGHLLCAQRRRRQGLRGRLRRLCHQAVRPAGAAGHDTTTPRAPTGALTVRTPPRILIVDDTPANVHILQTRLAASGYDIVTATDGEEALAAVAGAQPDLILLDVMMPKLDGFEVCRRLRAEASLPFIPIILVTAKADPKDIAAGLEAGGDEYLTKPVDQAALVARVKSMLRIKALHDTVQGLAEEPPSGTAPSSAGSRSRSASSSGSAASSASSRPSWPS